MSLNNISLPARMIAELYPFSLVEKVTPADIPAAIEFVGKNKKNILVLVCKVNIAFIEDNELNFLSSILAACKLSLDDVAIVNLNSLNFNCYRTIINQFKSNTVLMFDVASEAIDLPFNFPYFQLQQFDQCTYLCAPGLTTIATDKTLKTQLWVCLKNLFRV